MTKVAVVFHSGYGHTVKQAEAVANGAKGSLVAIDAEGNLTDAQWATLARLMGQPALAVDARFATAAGRRASATAK